MDVMGTVEEITCDGRLIVQCKELPDIGDPAFDRKQNRIGTVKKVFGPVDGPYAAITPEKGLQIGSLRGTDVFFKRGNLNGKSKGRNRRNRSMS